MSKSCPAPPTRPPHPTASPTRMPTAVSTTPHRSLRRWLGAALAGAALGCAPLPALHAAQALADDVPTLIDSDTLEYDDARQVSVFTGNVVLTRGPLSLRAHRLELRQAPNGDQFAVATAAGGKQVFVRQTNPEHVEVVEGHADRAEYDSNTNLLEFIGRAVVSRMACGQMLDQVQGERIRYNQETEVYTAQGDGQAGRDGRRVRTVIGSRQKSDQIITSCQSDGGNS